MKKREIKAKIKEYKERKKSLISQVSEIDRRYKKGHIDIQIYYEAILRNYGSHPKAILEDYNNKIEFYSSQLQSISQNNKNIFFTCLASLIILLLFFAFNRQITAFLISNETAFNETAGQSGNETPQNESLPNIPSSVNPKSNETKNIPEKNSYSEEGIVIEEFHERPAISKPVKWTKKVKKINAGISRISIPKEAENITIAKTDAEGKRELHITGLISLDIEAKNDASKNIFQRVFKFIKNLLIKTRITGKATENANLIEEESMKTLLLENPGDYEITFNTPAPQIIEMHKENYIKTVTVTASDLGYTDILTYTDIQEIVPFDKKEAIKVLWLEDNKYIPFEIEDTNNNGLIDRIIWNTPHLSNQTFEISITLINVQSYPTVGGSWEVRFTTIGTANLRIQPVDGTTWGLQEFGDLKFIEARCNNTSQEYTWSDESVIIENYSCSDMSYETSLVLTKGTHNLEFIFGDMKEYAHNFAVGRHQGMLAYGSGNSQLPRYRIWNGTGFTPSSNANNIGGVIEWLRLKASPFKDEYIMVTADNQDDINVQINSSIANAGCWHNGTACNTVLELETTSSAINRLKADVAYEQLSGHAIVVFSDNTRLPKFRIWNGSAWSSEAAVMQTRIASGIISYIKMAERQNSNEIALIFSNNTALSSMIWNGTAWTCEPTKPLSLELTPEIFQHADLAYEQNSGDLFIASTINNINGLDYTIKQNNECSYTTNRYPSSDENEEISVAPQYNSDLIMIAEHDTGLNHMQAVIWNGTSMLAASGNELSLLAASSPNIEIASGWSGKSKRGILVYSDAATSRNIDYFLYNITENVWEGGVNGLDAAGITNFNNEERNILSLSYQEENKILVIIEDSSRDLWAKVYNADTNSWIDADNGIALDTSISSNPIPAFDFAFQKHEINTPPQIKALPSQILPNINLLENSSRDITVAFIVNDSNGVQEINESTAMVEFTNAGEQTRKSQPGSCTKTALDTITANITCKVTMFFYDSNGTWNVRINITDNKLSDEKTSSVYVNELNSIAILSPKPESLSFPSMEPESTNLISTNSPLIIKNLGNRKGPIEIKACNLYGTAYPVDIIPANSFAASAESGSECNGTVLSNSTPITISGSMLQKGQNETEEIYFCLKQVPNIISQDYSTSAAGSCPWEIRILLATFIPRKRKKEKIKIDNKEPIIKAIRNSLVQIQNLSQQYRIDINSLISPAVIEKKDVKKIIVPISAFSKELGFLESLCKYLKDKCSLRYSEIASLLRRNHRTIWTSYSKASQKSKSQAIESREKTAVIGIPITELINKNLSIFESIVLFLRKQGYRYSEIADLLERDERNIWTTSKRAEKKSLK